MGPVEHALGIRKFQVRLLQGSQPLAGSKLITGQEPLDEQPPA